MMEPTDRLYFPQQNYPEFVIDTSHHRCETSSDEEKTIPSPRAVSDCETEDAEEIQELQYKLRELYEKLAFCNAHKACWVPLFRASIEQEIETILTKLGVVT